MTAPTLERLPFRIPGLALATAMHDYPMPAVDTPLAGAAEASVVFAGFESIFAAADKCPCCGKPKPGAVFGYDSQDSAK